MFTFDNAIEAVQNAQKMAVSTFVQNEQIKTELVKAVDAHAEATKKVSKSLLDTGAIVASESTKAFQNALKFDYSKFGDAFTKAFQTAKA